LAAYFGGIGFISMAAALAAPGVSPVVLGAGLMVLLSLIGLLVFVRLRSRFNSRPTWRDAMPGYLTVLNPNLRIIDSNEVFRRVFGDRLGERCFRVYKGVDKPCSDCAAQRTFLDGQVHTSEETVRSRNGDVINMVVTSAPLSEVDGQVSAVTAAATTGSSTPTICIGTSSARPVDRFATRSAKCARPSAPTVSWTRRLPTARVTPARRR
jgi:hypothetical protein